jgi:YVTN family beta-propeller protein
MKTYRLPLLLIIFGFAFSSSALAAPHSLFVPAKNSDEVAVINTSTNQVVTQIPVGVGASPIRIAITPDRRKAFISDLLSESISVLDTVTLTNIATIPVYNVPGESTITPDGRRLFVLHQAPLSSGDPDHSPVAVIDTATNLVITTVLIPGQGAKDILFTLDGRFAYVANNTLGEVDVIDTTTYQVTSIPTAPGSRRLCISPAGDRVYVSNNYGASVSVIDTATQQVIATIPVGVAPMGNAITPNGEEVYVTNQRDGTVSVINTTTLTVIATIPTGALCQRVVITRDGTKAFVQNGFSDTVSAIDTATHTVIATIHVGHQPWTILASANDMKLYVCNGGDTTVTVIDIPSLTVSDTIADVGSGPWDLAFGR